MTAAAILVLLAILGWASGRIPAHLVSLAFFLLAVLFHVAPPPVVFSGFTSGALWLIFGGQVMGVAIRHTGLAERLAVDLTGPPLGIAAFGNEPGGFQNLQMLGHRRLLGVCISIGILPLRKR